MLGVAGPLVRYLGLLGAARWAVKLATPRREFCCLLKGPEIVAFLAISIGFCRFYEVDESDIVLGSVWTSPQERGQGLATGITASSMNHMFARGCATFRIDTAEDNLPMQSVIQKCGFGPPVSSFER